MYCLICTLMIEWRPIFIFLFLYGNIVERWYQVMKCSSVLYVIYIFVTLLMIIQLKHSNIIELPLTYYEAKNCPSKQSVLHYYKFRQTENILRQNVHLITHWKLGGCVITQRNLKEQRRNLKRLTNSLWSFVMLLITFCICSCCIILFFLCVYIVTILQYHV